MTTTPNIPELARKADELVKRLEEKRFVSLLQRESVYNQKILVNPDGPEAASTILALTARIDELEAAVRQAPCPVPALQDELEAGQCFDRGHCGCVYGSALRYPEDAFPPAARLLHPAPEDGVKAL